LSLSPDGSKYPLYKWKPRGLHLYKDIADSGTTRDEKMKSSALKKDIKKHQLFD